MLTIIAPITVVVGALGALLPAIQIRKMIRERNAHGISVLFVIGGVVTQVVWTLYGIAMEKWALIAPDLVALAVGFSYLGTVLVLNRRFPYALSKHRHTVAVDHELDAELAELIAAHRASKLAGAAAV